MPSHAAVRQLSKMLANLARWLDAGREHAKLKGFSPDVLAHARLAPDQYPLARQVQSACDSAKLAAARLAGKTPPKHADTEQTLDELQARIETCRDYLATFGPGDFEGSADRVIELPFLEGKRMRGADYWNEFALPNFYFHVCTAYAILRHNGVDLGKRDFIGGVPAY
jgi:uncharacterized protein